MTGHFAFPLLDRRRLQLVVLQFFALLFAAACVVGAPQAQTAETDAADPPGRVGSISLLAGPVTMVDLQTGSREDAALNWPVTGGWRIEAGRGGRAEVRIGSTALRIDDDTTVDFVRLDDSFMQIAVLRGSAALTLRNREILNEIEVLTQRERIVFDDIGRYRIDVDVVPGQTAVTAFRGRSRIESGGNSFVVAAGQRGELTAPPLIRMQLAPASADRFDDWVAARDVRDDAMRSAGYVSRETTGVEVLDEYGDWRTVNDYGPVWFPRSVPSTWAPYRYGRWAWVDPWGWTWVDEAPWGFAPFHYGRWVVVGGVWGWVPGVIVPRPIYAPALVAWFGSPGVTISVGAPIGWFPLGPREVYVPPYRYSPRYLRVINVQHVPDVSRVTIVQTPRYVHRHPDRSTWLPSDRFGRPDPVYRGQRPPPSEWRQYIARPQPPANVPNTKRRQAANGSLPVPVAPVVPSDARPAVRPPAMAPRAIEAPRAREVPRTIEPPRAQPVVPPAARPEAPRGRGELPAIDRDERRVAPRAPSVAPQQPAPQPPADRGRGRDLPPPANGNPQRGRGELGATPREAARQAPRPPAPPAAARPPVQAAPPVAPPQVREAVRQPPPPARADRAEDRGIDRSKGRSPREHLR
jgi:hypothetical protein